MGTFAMYDRNAELIVLETPHGSHLYGLANEHSDRDNYEVFLGGTGKVKKYARQHIDKDKNDRMVLHLDRFIRNVEEGAPQALEALFSPQATIHPHYAPLLRNLRPSRYTTYDKYRRTALNFGLEHGGRSEARTERDSAYDRFKLARHALRLLLNLNDFMQHGWFNPTLTTAQAAAITTLAKQHGTPAYENTLRNMLSCAGDGSLDLSRYL